MGTRQEMFHHGHGVRLALALERGGLEIVFARRHALSVEMLDAKSFDTLFHFVREVIVGSEHVRDQGLSTHLRRLDGVENRGGGGVGLVGLVGMPMGRALTRFLAIGRLVGERHDRGMSLHAGVLDDVGMGNAKLRAKDFELSRL